MRLRISCGSRADVEAVDRHAARGRQQHAAEHAQRRRLAGAVEPEEADDLALLNGEGEIADGCVLAVVLGQTFDLDHLVISIIVAPLIRLVSARQVGSLRSPEGREKTRLRSLAFERKRMAIAGARVKG